VRLLALMAIFAFVSFAAVDPFMTEGSVWPLIKMRAVSVVVVLGILAVSTTAAGERHRTLLGCLLGSWTGISVVILTEMTGGAASPYWTMVMLTFFTVALVLPMTVTQALLCFGSVVGFYNVWLVSMDATASMSDWVMSNAGIGLSLLVSVAAVGFLSRVRHDQEAAHADLALLNESLRAEMADRARAESLALRSQQLDAVGRLAAGMAHELNNLLMVISGSAEVLRSGGGDLMKETKRIVDVAQRGGELTSGLLRYARKGQRRNERFALASVVEEVTDIIVSSQSGRVQVSLEVTTSPTWVCGDAAVLRQVLLNLCLNGIDAMDGEGRLRIGLETCPDRPALVLSVGDDGKGMSDLELAHAFDPFFTTKQPGKGTGLGLSMAYGAIEDHQGKITFETELGRGTCVVVTLPLSESPVPIDKKPSAIAAPSLGPTVLLIDDDDSVRAVIKQFLEASGSCIFEASNGPDGLELLARNHDAIDVVVLDMVMPNMDGAEVFVRLRERWPNLPVLICSGSMQDDALRRFDEAADCSFLSKPFESEELVSTIAGLLEAAAAKLGQPLLRP
jgi:signal transduction histidine kinase/CheY-like chemotaxis protein